MNYMQNPNPSDLIEVVVSKLNDPWYHVSLLYFITEQAFILDELSQGLKMKDNIIMNNWLNKKKKKLHYKTLEQIDLKGKWNDFLSNLSTSFNILEKRLCFHFTNLIRLLGVMFPRREDIRTKNREIQFFFFFLW